MELQKFLLEPGPGSDNKHQLVADRFTVPDRWRDVVDGKNILIVDDTWTTGSSAQGAAIAVKGAGASSVTVLCVDRWLRHDWEDHRTLIDTLDNPYDPLICPVVGRVCSRSADFRLTRV
ncbi:phosphoribosyltransferase [Nocardia panacis]|uniref:Phosphoribosyltransferase n=1 Tax=Nocardia panacis TaxID=2340916 RepID=A0A3A4KCC3_9NOCA|nr:phosphoribosyltransferase [Nocardia panacis]